jgi:hypothetical protein
MDKKLTFAILGNGIIAGLLGGVTVALWFLLFDALLRETLETPAMLGALLLHGASGAKLLPATWTLVWQYSVLHFAAFIIFGIAAAALIVAAEKEAGLAIALVIFFFAFEVFFDAIVLFHGPALQEAISWWSILVGNLLATGVMVSYFFFRHEALGRELMGPWILVVRQGVVAGVIGAATVAVWFVAYDTVANRPFYTPALLGSAFLEGIKDPATLQISSAVVLGYTVLHGTAFILFGVLAAVLLTLSEREPLLLLGVFVLFICFEVFFFGMVMVLDEALLEYLGWWTIFVANILAATAMLGYFLAKHRDLASRFFAEWAEHD